MGLLIGGGRPQPGTPELGNAGPVTGWGLPITRLAFDIAAIGTVGTAALPILLLPGSAEALTGTALRCLRAAALWAALWSVAAMVTAVFLLSDILGTPVSRIALAEGMWSIPQVRALGITAVGAAVLVFALQWVRSRTAGAVVLLFGIANLVPAILTGHAASTGAAAAFTLILHVVAVALWVGGLLAIVVHLRRSPRLLAEVVPRFSPLALACFAAVGVTGLTNAWLHMGGIDGLWQTRYGLLALVKACALVILAGCGWQHRRHTIRVLTQRLQEFAFVRWATVEITVMAITLAVAVSLSRTPPT